MPSSTENTTVIIPAYNEQSAIGNVITQVRSVMNDAKIQHEIIVVDDGSTDKTFEIAKTSGVRVIRHGKNFGYGASLKTGIRESKNDAILIIDADGTYPAKNIPKILEELGNSDMVVGARIGQNVNIPITRRPWKWLLRKLAEYITGETIPDLNSGLRAFHKPIVLQYINILSDKFSFTTTVTVALLLDNYKVDFIPIDYHKRLGKSKIVPWNFFEFLTIVLRLSMLFSPLKIFTPPALFSISIGTAKFTIDLIHALHIANGNLAYLFTHKVISSSVLILWLAGLQILLIGMVADGLIRKIAQQTTQNPSCSIKDTSK